MVLHLRSCGGRAPRWLIICYLLVWLAGSCGASDSSLALSNFLDSHFGAGSSKSYVSASVKLHSGPQSQIIVYLTGQEWCGNGGCTTLILEPKGSSYRLISKISVTRLPIRVLRSTTNGWHDIGVFVAGGGILPGYEARLRFDGKAYPRNPTVPPAVPVKNKAEGETVLSSE